MKKILAWLALPFSASLLLVFRQLNSSTNGIMNIIEENSSPKGYQEKSIPINQSQQQELPNTNKAKLNLLILYPDDWRHDSLEDARKPGEIHTPFLSQLAREGIRFTYNAVTTSICWISRATLFTGRYSSAHNSERLFCPNFTLEKWWKETWPSLLQNAGYFVGHVGKWQYRNSDQWKRGAFNWSRFHEGTHWQTRQNNTRIHTADLAKEDAIDFLRERPRDRPFALTVAFYPPKPVGRDTQPGAAWSPTEKYQKLYADHVFERPYNVTKAFEALPDFLKEKSIARQRYYWRWNSAEQYQKGMQNYYALVTHIDDSCREIINELKAQDQYNNTMIIFTTDNGLMQGAHGLAGKWHPWEESIRVPLIIHDPRMPHGKRGTLDDSFTLNVDLAQTILGAAGVNASAIMQGRDIADLYLSDNRTLTKDPWREQFFYEFPLSEFPSSTAFIRKDWKYIQWPNQNYEQLFDLQNDPYELNNLANSTDIQPLLNRLRKEHERLRTSVANTGYEKPICSRNYMVVNGPNSTKTESQAQNISCDMGSQIQSISCQERIGFLASQYGMALQDACSVALEQKFCQRKVLSVQ